MINSVPEVAAIASANSEKPPLKTDPRPHARLGWWIVLAGLGSFVFWAMVAPLEKGVPMAGTVTVAGNKKAIQHLSGGTVEAILVREGDAVRAGQTLVRMNSVQARTNAAITRIQFVTARITEARLMAERDGLNAVPTPPDIETSESSAGSSHAINIQQQLFVSRRSALTSELSAIDENIAGLQSFNAALEASREGKRLQLGLLLEQLEGMRELARDGFVPRNRLLELERTYAQMTVSMSDDTGNLGRSLRQIAELKLRRLQRQQDFQNQVQTQLAETQKEVDALRNRLEALDYELANASVRSPVDGLVADVSIFTEGGVVAPGFRMMDVLPTGERLVVEGQVPVHLIDSVRAGLPVELIFSAFNQNTTPRIPAVVTQVSPDRLIDAQTGLPYYRMQTEVTPQGRSLMTTLDVRPGMPVELFVKTGERTLMSYLVRPLQDNFKMSLTEE